MAKKAYRSGFKRGYQAARAAHETDVRAHKNEALPNLVKVVSIDDWHEAFFSALPEKQVASMLGVRRVWYRGAPTKATRRAMAEYGTALKAGVLAYEHQISLRAMR